ncbi:hypothetical protein GTP55_25455 [Duganella sp. FT109W]|uniref:Uncharacterized protein n=1 Tax=Duganella margarita TaxID=2692170 RepID=A0ABW9WRF9_9BURK|nr:hypothetical protein [Duganella margarita]MYN42695.1 hypothetical protein [Duganella margarita]
MQYPSAVVTINHLTVAAFLVDSYQTYTAPGTRLIAGVQRYFPTLPIILVSPRIGGFSRSFAHFDTTNIIKHINTDEIDWQMAALPVQAGETPF